MKNVIKAPKEYSTDKLNIFLAGSIDMGKAENWQDKVCFDLQEFDVQLLNPRRSDWDSSWEQSINNLKFKEQVDWELQGLEDSDIIIVYFDPNGKAPITLLELGLFKDYRMIVCCPDGYSDTYKNTVIKFLDIGVTVLGFYKDSSVEMSPDPNRLISIGDSIAVCAKNREDVDKVMSL